MQSSVKLSGKFICPDCKKETTFRFYQALYECFDVTSITEDSIPYVGLHLVDDPPSRRVSRPTDCFYQCTKCHTTWERLSDLIYDIKRNTDN